MALALLMQGTNSVYAAQTSSPVRAPKGASSDFFYNSINYNFGKVVCGTQNTYPIFWEPSLNVEKNYNSTISSFYQNEQHSAYYRRLSAYTQSNPSCHPSDTHYVSYWLDTSAYPLGRKLTDADIQNEVKRAVAYKHWPTGLNSYFPVYLQKNTDLCYTSSNKSCVSNSDFCAYHSNFGSTVYAVLPYAASFKGCMNGISPHPNGKDADSEIDSSAHEQVEAVTDPTFRGWFMSYGGGKVWEISDQCQGYYGQGNSKGADVTWNGHGFIIPAFWSNNSHSCVMG